MDVLTTTKKIIIFYLTVAIFSLGCAKLIPAAPQAEEFQRNSGSGGSAGAKPEKGEESNPTGQALSGQFKLASGESLNLAEVSKEMPTIVFFAGEFCSACREETENLLSLFKEKGLPVKVKLITVLVGSNFEDITGWAETFENSKIEWIVGADDDSLSLYKNYFTKLVTPSILFYDPQTNAIKKWQDKISIEQLQKETTPWY